MTGFEVILPPIIGGAIGYFTNDLAIKMLFRPYEAKYIGRFRVPFTPGIVSKRKEALAVLLGREVEAQFFNADDLELVFQSEAFKNAVAGSVSHLLTTRKTTLCLALEEAQDSEAFGPVLDKLKGELKSQAQRAALNFDYSPVIEGAAAQVMNSRRGELPRGTIKNALTVLAPLLSDGIKNYLDQEGREVIGELVEETLVDFADRPVCDIAARLCTDTATLENAVKEAYGRFMRAYVRRVVESIDVAGMITEKLRCMETRAIETLILSVVGKEFRYVVLLGGLIGAVIGAVNIFI